MPAMRLRSSRKMTGSTIAGRSFGPYRGQARSYALRAESQPRLLRDSAASKTGAAGSRSGVIQVQPVVAFKAVEQQGEGPREDEESDD